MTRYEELEKEHTVTGIAGDKNVAKIAIFGVPDLPGVAAKVFEALAQEKINVDMIIQSAMRNNINDISFTVPKDELVRALEIVRQMQATVGFTEIAYADDVVKVSIVGAGMVSAHGVAARMFSALAEKGINLEMISTSEIKVSCVIKNHGDNIAVAMQALHDVFELDKLDDRAL